MSSETESNSKYQKANQHKCSYEDCNRTFAKLSRLKHHLRIHNDERPFICDISGCKRRYTRSYDLARHKQGHKDGTLEKPRYVCVEENCMKTFKTMYIFERHCKRFHQNRKFKCDVCEKRFHKKQHLMVHSYEHTNVKPFVCPHKNCGKRFLIPSKLKAHQVSHLDFVCPEADCGFELDSRLAYKKHMACHYKTEFLCSDCGKMFVTITKLNQHSLIHAVKREVFHCPKSDCFNKYYKMSSLKSHIKIKHEGKRFCCTYEGCESSYSSKQKLQMHEISHDPGYIRKRRGGYLKSKKFKMSDYPLQEGDLNFLASSELIDNEQSDDFNTVIKAEPDDSNTDVKTEPGDDDDDNSVSEDGEQLSEECLEQLNKL